MADGFLGRWSQRKRDAREGKPLQESAPAPVPLDQAAASRSGPQGVNSQVALAPVPTAPSPEVAEPPPPPTLADAQALTPASDFKPFVARAVSPEVRNLAMKKLFADPHFNVMDGLDIYVGDYTQPDPLPAGMLRKMASAHALGFFDHEKKNPQDNPVQCATLAAEGDPAGGAPATPISPIAPAAAQPRDDAEAQSPADVAQSRVCNAVPSVPSSEPEMAIRSAEDAMAIPASHTHNDHDAHLRLQPDDAPQRQGVGRGAA